MMLEPGERSPVHHHEHDYIVVVAEGDQVTVEPLEAGSRSAPVVPGHSVLLRKGGTEAAVNRRTERYRDAQIELLDS